MLDYFNDTTTLDNGQYNYRNHKISSQRLVVNKTMAPGLLFARLAIGAPKQVQEVMVDTASSWLWVDSYGAKGPDHSLNTYLLSEEKDSSLDCSSGRVETI